MSTHLDEAGKTIIQDNHWWYLEPPKRSLQRGMGMPRLLLGQIPCADLRIRGEKIPGRFRAFRCRNRVRPGPSARGVTHRGAQRDQTGV